MSNRRKPRQERQQQPSYGTKSRWRKSMFPGLSNMGLDFEVIHPREPSGRKDRSLRGKARVKARKAAQRAERAER